MINGIIYIIVNLHNIQTKTFPYFYLGSTKRTTNFEKYYGSSKDLTKDVKTLGTDKFHKLTLVQKSFSSVEELQLLESEYQTQFNVVDDPIFYNKSLANGPFYNFDGSHAKDSVWITNSIINKRIPFSKISEFPNFTIGRSNGKYMKNRIYINNGKITKSINASDKCKYPLWNVGRLSGNQKGKMWINNLSIRKLISITDRNKFPTWKDGWKI